MGMGITRRLTAIPDTILPGGSPVSAGVATTVEDRMEAARLVGRLYRAEGYLRGRSNAEAPFLTPHHLLLESTVFVARERGRIVGTLTVVLDSIVGLPLEALYPEDVVDLREQGRTPCEICSLALDPRHDGNSSRLLLSLFRAATSYILHFTPTTDALITLKPSHAAFYERRLRFQVFGKARLDPRFRGAETVARRLAREACVPVSAREDHPMSIVFGPASPEELEDLRGAVSLKELSREKMLRSLAPSTPQHPSWDIDPELACLGAD